MTTVLPADKFDTAMTFIKPADAPLRVSLDKLAVLPGFNTRVKDEEYKERVSVIAESIAANGFFDDKPFAVTMLPDDDTVYIFDGEHRFDAAKQATLDGAAFPEGLPVAWAKDGSTVRDLTIHLIHGNNSERLNMVEMAAVVRRLQGLGLEKDEIAKEIGRTTRHIDNLFVLADANQTVKKAVASGKIAGAEAVKLLRRDPKTAAAKITEAVKKAEEKGKKKATPKSMASAAPAGRKMKGIKHEIILTEGEVMGVLLKNMAGIIREHVKIGDEDKLTEPGKLTFVLSVVDHEAEAAAAKKEQEKAEREKAREAKAAAEKKKQAEATAKREAEKALLAEAAAKKKPATKKKPVSAAEAKKKAQEHLSGGKAPEKAKTTRTRKKAAQPESKPEATTEAPTSESSPDTAETQPLDEASMGGL